MLDGVDSPHRHPFSRNPSGSKPSTSPDDYRIPIDNGDLVDSSTGTVVAAATWIDTEWIFDSGDGDGHDKNCTDGEGWIYFDHYWMHGSSQPGLQSLTRTRRLYRRWGVEMIAKP